MKLNNDYQSQTFGMAMLKPTKKAISGYAARRAKEAGITVEQALQEITEAKNIIEQKDKEFIETCRQLLKEKGIKEKKLPCKMEDYIAPYEICEEREFQLMNYTLPDGYMMLHGKEGSCNGSIVDFVNITAEQMYSKSEQDLANSVEELVIQKKNTPVYRLKTRVTNFFNKLIRKTKTQNVAEQLSKEEQVILDKIEHSGKAYNELTQEEKNIVNKHTKILEKEMDEGLEKMGFQRTHVEEPIKKFVNGLKKKESEF